MHRIRFLGIIDIVLVLMVGCDSAAATGGKPTATLASATATPIPEVAAAEEYRVYSDMLTDYDGMWNIPAATDTVVIFDHTLLRNDPDDARAILQDDAGISEELIANFLEANKQSSPVEPRFEFGKPVLLVSPQTIDDLVRGLRYAEQCLHTVHAVYPAPEYGGWYHVSRVGFDAQMQTAVLYIEQSLCGGSGNYLVLERESGRWTIKGWAIGLLSDMGLDSPKEIGDEEYAVYNALLAECKGFCLGSGFRYVTVYDQTGLPEELLQPEGSLYTTLHEEMPTVSDELVAALVAVNEEAYSLAPHLSFEVPVLLVSWHEYERLSEERNEPECLATVRERFPVPQFQGWLRLSRVAFNQAHDEALVYIESNICRGVGFAVLMEKHGDLWEMMDYTRVWVS